MAQSKQFNEYRSCYHNRVQSGFPVKAKKDEVYNWLRRTAKDHDIRLLAPVEEIWHELRCPYYRIYPAILPMMLGLKLDLPTSYLKLPLAALAINTPVSDGLLGGLTILACQVDSKSISIVICPNEKTRYILIVGNLGEDTIEAGIENQEQAIVSDALMRIGYLNPEIEKAALRIVASICLLSNDPELILPDVLNKDTDKWERAGPVERARIEEKAYINGKVGWLVGSRIEVTPHFRRPHLFLAWTGPGRKSTEDRSPQRLGCAS